MELLYADAVLFPSVMALDAARFRDMDVIAIHGARPHCIVTNLWQHCDLHHILGRGYDFGARGDQQRKPFSSIFNCAPINRDIHQGPRRDNTYFRKFLLSVIRETVFNAIGTGSYELTKVDEDFLRIADEWLSLHP